MSEAKSEIDIIAHALTGHVGGVCCNKTGGLSDDPKCECRIMAAAALEAIKAKRSEVEITPEMCKILNKDFLVKGTTAREALRRVFALIPSQQPNYDDLIAKAQDRFPKVHDALKSAKEKK